MEIISKTTNELSLAEWSSYVDSFNKVFSKNFSKDYFEQKYLKTIRGFSFHSFLKEENQVVGGCTVIPYEYLINNSKSKIGLVVDVFILKDKRNDPLTLLRMYKKLKADLIDNGISLIIAVPNDVVYLYWKNIVKWKDIGSIKYYIYPIKISKIKTTIPSLLNIFSWMLTRFQLILSYLSNSKELLKPIRIDRNNKIIYEQKYHAGHLKIETKDSFFSYNTVLENGVNTCYIIDFYEKKTKLKSQKSLRNAIKHIQNKEQPDVIIFVGQLNFRQCLMIKVPTKFEPRTLHLTTDIYAIDHLNLTKDFIMNIKNWDFGLFNFDVR